MNNPKGQVLIGNILLSPAIIRKFLVDSNYWLNYGPKTEIATLNANNGDGGEVLLELRNVSYESASKLAYELGFEGRGDTPFMWDIHVPVIRFGHDGTPEADELLLLIVKLDIPHQIIRDQTTLWMREGGDVKQKGPAGRGFSLAQMKEEVEAIGKRRKKKEPTEA